MTENTERSYSPFWPIAIIALTYLILAVWQISITGFSLKNNIELSKQFAVEQDKAKIAEKNMNNFYQDLLELAKTDADAKIIVDQNQISKKSNTP